ncbi:PREDICTED: ankyrin repeat and SAM domain-containing protein 1A [Rhagoletis zephyria]|uniref:ankyrin repeat and SAM domain-containing protein 1A n=1 Tax=Rhagoletis zephyria TaxID=28612 RepID=UPI0008118F30|nr:PREDICTED: ankyrin repeat and SAM domain-containing protein 1A [Rhagoletis zephyria]XP_017484641.1 PREDICTED: ankyrin repeat and SAM domain-containing protein 1A [Rhagoletis zephyria]XP_017484650.1 PREDICTED: ankyrin repeat and SAM domain-containing protein 1A [Rhagoletis zephyria]XP_017484657.1 PREDICTED: ankyrin repeat and SAM domain-containing protein 1A [Rhagoletis zephyria]
MGKDQEFLDAARNGNISYIEKVLNQRAKRAGPLASLRRGPGVNIQDSGGYSALHHACLNGHSDIVRLLLNNEASPNLPDSRGSSPLHLAAWAGHQEIVKMLLSHPYKPAQPNLQTIENETPLHCAAQHGHTGALAVLLAHNADPNMRNSRGETPLDLAAQYGRLQAVQMLIRAHPELIAHYSVAAIEGVSNSGGGGGGGGVVGQQRPKSRHSSPLPHSGSVSTPSPSSPSITSSPATPTRNIFPHTCLHVASRNGHKNVVEVLLAAGVSVNLLTPSGTALHEAALCGKESVVRTLLRAGIDLNATDAEGRTALDILKEFPPHVTKHIIAVINNFRNQMDVDDNDEVVVFRHQHPPPPPQRQSSSLSHYQKQQHNNHYHFNSNNHLLNHAHSLQQSSTYTGNSGGGGGNGGSAGGGNSSSSGGNNSKHRYGTNFNGGKSLDSGLQPDHYGIGGRGGGYYEVNSPVHSTSNNSQNEMGVSPSSSMSSFEPVSVSPRSRSSTGGIVALTANNPMHMSTFAPGAPPKKPPRRNLSVSPTHSGQQFSYTSPNHQQHQQQQSARMRQQHHSPSTEIPHSGRHQSHGSVGGMSFDETTQLRDRQRGDRLYASSRESARSATGALLTSSSNDMLERMNYSSEEPADSADGVATSNSMKRPLNKSRDVSTDIINCENPTLKSYNPNRKLKRNRNSCSLSISDTKENKNGVKPQTPLSPTNYQQPPTPDHPPPSSSHAERTIHERIRPLSMEYKRRSALMQLQQQQQQQQKHSKSMIDSSTSPAKNWQTALIPTPTFDYPVGSLSPKQSANASPTTTMSNARRSGAGIRGSSGSLSSSVSLSDQSISTDCVEEFVGDAPFAGLFKGSSVNLRHEKRTMGNHKLGIPPPSARRVSASATEDEQQQKQQRTRPPIPTKPILPDCTKMLKPLPIGAKDNKVSAAQAGCDETEKVADNTSRLSQSVSICLEGENVNGNDNDGDNAKNGANNNGNDNDDIDAALSTITAATTQSSGILSPFNAEEARKKISEIIESFGSGILNSTLTPTNDIELEFDETIEPMERRELAVRLRNAGLLHLERMLFENGYDNFKFLNGVFEPSDTQLMDLPTPDANKLISFVRTLPKVEFQPQIIATNNTRDTKAIKNGDAGAEKKGVATLSEWLQSISLPEYIESFSKHLYNTIDSVCGVWDVELQTVLEINKLGHRRRILQSVAYIRQIREPNKSGETDNHEITKLEPPANGECGNKEPQQPKPAQHAQPQQRTSITGYRKNRPAPQPPTEKPQQQQLQIRAPSELLLGLPANLRTKWRHSANVLLNEQIKYEVYYLGSTVVKELRGTESTRKSIQKLKRDDTAEQQKKNNRSGNLYKKKPAQVCLAISHLGVEFIDVNSKHTICEHEIQNINCACQDSDDLRHFAYITKELDIHYCHVFSVESTDLATDIILTLGQAFEVAYQLALRDGITQTSAAALSGNSLLSGPSSGEAVTAE